MKPVVVSLIVALIVQPVLAQMPGAGWSGINPSSMYNYPGSPVMGAYQGNQFANMGSGQSMMNQCPYQQQVYVDPTDKNPDVIGAKADLLETDENILESKRAVLEAQQAVNAAKRELGKTLIQNISVDTFIRSMNSCESFTASVSVHSLDAWTTKLDGAMSGAAEKAQCYNAGHLHYDQTSNFDASGICLGQDVSNVEYIKTTELPPSARNIDSTGSSRAPASVGVDTTTSEAPGNNHSGATKPRRARRSSGLTPANEPVPAAPTAAVGPVAPTTIKWKPAGKNTSDEEACKRSATELHTALADLKKAQDELKSAKDDQRGKRKAINDARSSAQKDLALQQEIDQLKSERMTAQTSGVLCESCGQQPGVNKWALIAAGVMGIGLTAYGISTQRQEQTYCARLGFMGCNQNNAAGAIGSFSTATNAVSPLLAYGLNPGSGGYRGGYGQGGYNQGGGVGAYGYPMAANNLYGTVPGGYTSGGLGCAQTINGSQMMNPGLMMANGGQYMPGGYGMPGMTNMGIPGYGQNPNAFGMYQQQASDIQRSMYLQQLEVNQAYTGFNQNLGLAYSQMQNMGAMGQMQYGLMGSQPSTYGLNSYLGSTFASPYARQGCGGGGGSPFGGTSFSICGTVPLGGSYAPTYSNGYSGFGNTGFGNTGFGGSSFGASGTFSR